MSYGSLKVNQNPKCQILNVEQTWNKVRMLPTLNIYLLIDLVKTYVYRLQILFIHWKFEDAKLHRMQGVIWKEV